MNNDFEMPNDSHREVHSYLKYRYEIYVECMIAIKKPHKTFNEWLGV
jgi:hypothetical protein